MDLIKINTEARKDIEGRRIVSVSDYALHLDNGRAIYLSQEEIEDLNIAFENRGSEEAEALK